MNQPVVTLETIDANVARLYFAKNNKNRPLREYSVKAHEKRLREGSFIDYAQTIMFDINDNLIDGQHRLLAIINTGIPAKFIVVRNLPVEVAQVIDQGEVRDVKDIISLNPLIKDLKDIKYLSEKISDTKKLFTGFGVEKEDRETNNAMANFILDQSNAEVMESLQRIFDRNESGLNKSSVRAGFLNFCLKNPNRKEEVFSLARKLAGKESGLTVKDSLRKFEQWHQRVNLKAAKSGSSVVRPNAVYSRLLQAIDDQLNDVKRKQLAVCTFDSFTNTKYSETQDKEV